MNFAIFPHIHIYVFQFSGKKEISALRLMVQSYTNNPKFGDASKFQSELDSAIYNVQVDISIFYHFLPF